MPEKNKHDKLPTPKANSLDLERFKLIIRKEVIQNLKEGNYNRDVLKEIFGVGSDSPLNDSND